MLLHVFGQIISSKPDQRLASLENILRGNIKTDLGFIFSKLILLLVWRKATIAATVVKRNQAVTLKVQVSVLKSYTIFYSFFYSLIHELLLMICQSGIV